MEILYTRKEEYEYVSLEKNDTEANTDLSELHEEIIHQLDEPEPEPEPEPENGCEFEETAISEAENIKPLPLLPPDHPLLKRFQDSLKSYLLRTKAELLSDIDSIKHNLKEKEQQREDRGATLYDLQQEIYRQNEQLEAFTEQIQEHITQRQQEEETVSRLKKEYEERAQLTKTQKTLYNQRIVELERMQELEMNIQKWADGVDDEVKNAKRVVNRDTQLQKMLSVEKSKSDLLFYHLDMEVKKSDQELKLLQNEIHDMEQVNNVLKMSVSGANTDLEVLENEHKHLAQAWTEVIVAISLRDRILNDVNISLNKVKESIKLNTLGVQAVKKHIKKEMALNEKLENFKKRLFDDLIGLKRDCRQQSIVLNDLQQKLKDIPEIMDKTEQDLNEAKREGIQLETNMRRLQLVIDKLNAKKYELEEGILKFTQDNLITDNANSYRMKMIRNVKDARRNMELTLAQTQNTLATTLLDIERYKGYNYRQSQGNNEVEKEIKNLEKKADNIKVEIKQMDNQINVKMLRMDKLMKQYDELQHVIEVYDDTNIVIKVQHLEKSIPSLEQQIQESQKVWIMLQNHFVTLTQKRHKQLNQINITQKQLSIIKQKSLKVDQEIENVENITRELSRDIHVYRTKLDILNAKIFNKRKQHENEENECQNEHNDLMEKLKHNEYKVLHLEEAINNLQIDIDYHKDIVLDKHRECLSWETKYKLIEETLRWRKSESSLDNELGTMRLEIHRMQIRYQQLKRAQDKLLQDFDRCAMHREQIFNSVTAKQKIEAKQYKFKQSHQSFERKIVVLRNKLQQTEANIQQLTDHQLIESDKQHEELKENIRQLRAQIVNIMDKNKKILMDIDEKILMKHYNLENIICKQSRAKSYRHLIQSKQPFKLSRTESIIEAQLNKQSNINLTLLDIIQTLDREHPERHIYFLKILQTLQNTLQNVKAEAFYNRKNNEIN